MTVIKYGDKIHILNGYNVWEGGYLDTNGHSTDGDTYNVSTNESATRDASLTGTWVLVCDSKHVGAEVISGDVIHVKNLYAAGTYLDSINHFPTKPGKYKVETATTSHRDGGSGTWHCRQSPPVSPTARSGSGTSSSSSTSTGPTAASWTPTGTPQRDRVRCLP